MNNPVAIARCWTSFVVKTALTVLRILPSFLMKRFTVSSSFWMLSYCPILCLLRSIWDLFFFNIRRHLILAIWSIHFSGRMTGSSLMKCFQPLLLSQIWGGFFHDCSWRHGLNVAWGNILRILFWSPCYLRVYFGPCCLEGGSGLLWCCCFGGLVHCFLCFYSALQWKCEFRCLFSQVLWGSWFGLGSWLFRRTLVSSHTLSTWT